MPKALPRRSVRPIALGGSSLYPLQVRVSVLRSIASYTSFQLESTPRARNCAPRLPRTVASAGPAMTTSPDREASAWQNASLCEPPPPTRNDRNVLLLSLCSSSTVEHTAAV